MYLTVKTEAEVPKGFRSLKQLWAEGYRIPNDGKAWTEDTEQREFGHRLAKIQWEYVHNIRDTSDASRRQGGGGTFMLPSEAETMVRQNLACDLEKDGEIYFGPDAVRHLEDSGLIVKRWAAREPTDLSRSNGERSL